MTEHMTFGFLLWSHWWSSVGIHSHLLEISHGNQCDWRTDLRYRMETQSEPTKLISMRGFCVWPNLTFRFLLWSHRWGSWNPFIFSWDIAQKPLSKSEATEIKLVCADFAHHRTWPLDSCYEATDEVSLKSIHIYSRYRTETNQPIRGHWVN